jgi:hypothetical protein
VANYFTARFAQDAEIAEVFSFPGGKKINGGANCILFSLRSQRLFGDIMFVVDIWFPIFVEITLFFNKLYRAPIQMV